MSESASVEVLTAEVRVLQVGDGQITRFMYWQLHEATFEQFEPFGRVRDNNRKPDTGVLHLVGRNTKTGALVRYDARPPDWSASDAPDEFTHWLSHQPEIRRRIGNRDKMRSRGMRILPSSGGKVSIGSAMLPTPGMPARKPQTTLSPLHRIGPSRWKTCIGALWFFSAR
jgi:hypothetical protein